MPIKSRSTALIAAANAALQREGRNARDLRPRRQRPARLPPLREFLVDKLKSDAGIACTRRRHPDHLGLAAGARSGQRRAARARRHRDHRAGHLSGHAQPLRAARRERRSASRSTAMACAWTRCRTRSTISSAAACKPKFIYTIPTVQNPTGTIMPEARRVEMLRLARRIRRADLRGRLLCRPDLGRPAPARALRHERRRRRHPYRLVLEVDRAGAARRLHRRAVGDACRACWRSRPTPAPARVEQMVLAEYCAPNFSDACAGAAQGLRAKLDTLMEALNEQFGTAAEFDEPQGRHLPVGEAARQRRHDEALPGRTGGRRRDQSGAGVVGRQGHSRSRMRLCFASPTHEEIREGIAILAEVCRREFGVPTRIANMRARRRRLLTRRTQRAIGLCAFAQLTFALTAGSSGSFTQSSPPQIRPPNTQPLIWSLPDGSTTILEV